MFWFQWLTYISVVIAVVAIIVKVLRYVMAPLHFRWELYPVPHEKGRGEYGGSYLEELDWWSKPRHYDLINEIKEMMMEIFLLKGVFHHNKRVWLFSMPFHQGLYLCIGWLLLLLLGSILEASGIILSTNDGWLSIIVHFLTVFSGYAGLFLTGFGALGLFIWRATDANQKPYNSPADYFNLLFINLVVVMALVAHFSADSSFVFLRGYIHSLITFVPINIPSPLLTIEILLLSLIIMYIPLTRMSHFVAKYFLYHAVRWSDTPNARGSKIEKQLMELLQKKVSWKAPHIQTGQSWIEVIKKMNDE